MRTETRAKAAILNSYTEPVAYKDYIFIQRQSNCSLEKHR